MNPTAAVSRRTAIAGGLAAIAVPARAADTRTGGYIVSSCANVVLLGDSILDNKSYTAGGTDVITHLRGRLPPGCGCTLAAQDGSVTRDVADQLSRSPAPASHVVISAGGNDALRQEAVFGQPAGSVGQGLVRLAAVRDRFLTEYRSMLDTVAARALPTAVCTIYDPRFPDPLRQRLASLGLVLFNDVIIREAFARGLAVIDLRLICNEPGDLANPIEPSVQGGAKIAAAIVRFAVAQAGAARPSVVTGR